MSLKPFEMGTLEIRLRWIVVVRIFWMLFIPLFIALLFNNWVIKVIVYLVTAFLFWTLVGSWGHSVIALMTGLLPLYLYFEIEAAPDWLAYLAGLLAAFELTFINHRIKEVEALRDSISDEPDLR